MANNAVALFVYAPASTLDTSTDNTASPAYIFPIRVYITASDLTKTDDYLTKVLYSVKFGSPRIDTNCPILY